MKEQMKQYEKGLLNEIEARGYVRVVKHEIFDNPTNFNLPKIGISPSIKANKARAITTIGLVKKEKYDSTPKKENLIFDVVAHAICSWHDQFSKRIGRIKATKRALNQLD